MFFNSLPQELSFSLLNVIFIRKLLHIMAKKYESRKKNLRSKPVLQISGQLHGRPSELLASHFGFLECLHSK